MNFTKEHCQYLIDHDHTFVGLLPVSTAEQNKETNIWETIESRSANNISCAVPLWEELNQTLQTNGNDLKIAILQEAMLHVLGSSSAPVKTEFEVLVCGKG